MHFKNLLNVIFVVSAFTSANVVYSMKLEKSGSFSEQGSKNEEGITLQKTFIFFHPEYVGSNILHFHMERLSLPCPPIRPSGNCPLKIEKDLARYNEDLVRYNAFVKKTKETIDFENSRFHFKVQNSNGQYIPSLYVKEFLNDHNIDARYENLETLSIAHGRPIGLLDGYVEYEGINRLIKALSTFCISYESN